MTGTLPFDFASKVPGLVAFTTTRQGGISAGNYASLNLGLHVGDEPASVLENRRSLVRALPGLEAVCLRQVHGSEIIRVGQEAAGSGWKAYGEAVADADGLVCSEPGLALSIGHADCLALVLVDPVKRSLGMAHAGWRGALAGIARNLVERMTVEFGSRPADLWGGLSPCLGPCCLELSASQHRDFQARHPGADGFCGPLADGHFKLDLWGCCRSQLTRAGVAESRIETQALCTGHHPELFFSHRRDRGTTGRMMTFAGFQR